jgi:hypothetical protein
MCLEEMATQNDENCVRIQCHWKVLTYEEKDFDAITGLTYGADYVCKPENRVPCLIDFFYITI